MKIHGFLDDKICDTVVEVMSKYQWTLDHTVDTKPGLYDFDL